MLAGTSPLGTLRGGLVRPGDGARVGSVHVERAPERNPNKQDPHLSVLPLTAACWTLGWLLLVLAAFQGLRSEMLAGILGGLGVILLIVAAVVHYYDEERRGG